jgi:hypothetical protein
MKGSHAAIRLALVCAVVLVSGLVASAALPADSAQPQVALGTGFTYQGRLTDNGSPAEGAYDFQFKLYDAPIGGNLLGTVTPGDVAVSGALFTIKLNFGAGVFSGDARWLEIGVRPGDSGGAYTLLDPRQELTPSPYALALPGLWTQQNATSPNLIGGYNGNWTTAGVTGGTIGGGGDVNWPNRVTDRFGTVGGGQNNQAGDGDGDPAGPTHATVGGGWQNIASGSHATVGGGANNIASDNDATVAGGHENSASANLSTVGGGQNNQAIGDSTMVGGGQNNQAIGNEATIGGGSSNTADGWRATVGGGSNNVASGDGATIAGGDNNVASGGWAATVGGGNDHIVSGSDATVGGGNENTASSDRSTVGGGQNNTASGDSATVAGGQLNTASGQYAAVPGGFDNFAQGGYSFAAGRSAKAYNGGCFVWGDATDADVTCDNDNRWVARASGGVYFYTNSGLSSGVYVPAGDSAWSSVSDRNLKDNFAAVDGQEVLARLAKVPVTSWNYKSQDPSIRHMGPMAQDLYTAFGLGEDDTHISTVDADGVALAAIQGLYAENQALKAEVAAQQQQLDEVTTRLAALEKQQAPARTGGLPLGWLALGGVTVAAGLVVQRRPRGGGR